MIDTKDGTLKALLRAATDGDHTATLAALDRLEETGHEGLAAELRKALQMFLTLLAEEGAMHFAALALHDALGRVDVDAIAVVTTDRGIALKEQAALARRLFKSLGLAGISVTMPGYSIVPHVEVKLPYRRDGVRDSEAERANEAAYAKVEAILAVAFPNHDDRSEPVPGRRYDYKWRIDWRGGDHRVRLRLGRLADRLRPGSGGPGPCRPGSGGPGP
jgi:hypothetical protein